MTSAIWAYALAHHPATWVNVLEIGRLQTLGIDRVFLSLDESMWKQTEKLDPTDPAFDQVFRDQVADFIDRARSAGISVYAMTLEGPGSITDYKNPMPPSTATDLIDHLIAYNRWCLANRPSAAFDGIHIDAEPNDSTIWPHANPATAADYQLLDANLIAYRALLAAVRTRIRTYNTTFNQALKFSATLTWWFDSYPTELPNGQSDVLAQDLDELVVQAYDTGDPAFGGLLTDIDWRVRPMVQKAPTIVGIMADNHDYAAIGDMDRVLNQLMSYDWMIPSGTKGAFLGISIFSDERLLVSDLSITPWGAVTGIGPQWQSRDIFVVDAQGNAVDANGNPLNAVKGQKNYLRARVTNWGKLPASLATARFQYAPWYVGIPDSSFMDIGTVTNLTFAAGEVKDTIEVPWDLTILGTTYDSWPGPIGNFEHFCVRASITRFGDFYMGDNAAQTNFFNVTTLTAGPYPLIVGNPFGHAVEAKLILSAYMPPDRLSKLPDGFGVVLTPEWIREFGQPFTLQAHEIRTVTIRFARPKDGVAPLPATDVIAELSLEINGKNVGGISALLHAAGNSGRDNR